MSMTIEKINSLEYGAILGISKIENIEGEGGAPFAVGFFKGYNEIRDVLYVKILATSKDIPLGGRKRISPEDITPIEECDEIMVICPTCGQIIPWSLMEANENGKYFCHECMEVGVFPCPICCEWHRNDEEGIISLPSGEKVCKDCTFAVEHCAICGKLELNYRMNYSENGSVCNECYSHINRCYCCGRELSHTRAYELEGGIVCPSCYKDIMEEYYFIGYHEKPHTLYHGKSLLQIGFELETVPKAYEENKSFDLTKQLRESFTPDDLYFKRDGSLIHEGVEIISHTCDLEYYQNSFNWEALCSAIAENNFTAESTECSCGLHFHISRVALGKTELQRRKVIARIAILLQAHWNSIEILTRRDIDNLHQWADLVRNIVPVESQEEGIYNAYPKADRYYALNLKNSNTIEFRMFAGANSKETILADIEFCVSIINYAKTHSLKECLNSMFYDLFDFSAMPELANEIGRLNIPNTDPELIHNERESKFKEGDIVILSDIETWSLPEKFTNLIGKRFVIEIATKDYCGRDVYKIWYAPGENPVEYNGERIIPNEIFFHNENLTLAEDEEEIA